MTGPVINRLVGKFRRLSARYANRRPALLRNPVPLISFTFDDFPSSALEVGGALLEEVGARGTYYSCLGLMGREAPTGMIFKPDELAQLLARGHELGCHTFDHRHSFDTAPSAFEASVLRNRAALEELAPQASMPTLSYPISVPRPGTKRRCSRYFLGARAGGQTFEVGQADLNALSAFFLEQARDDLNLVRRLLDAAVAANGLLIFATHDVSPNPTRYGVTPLFFKTVVRYATNTGAKIVPLGEALRLAGVSDKSLL